MGEGGRGGGSARARNRMVWKGLWKVYTIPPHQLRLSYKFTIVFIEEIRLVSLTSLLLLTVVME